MNEDIALGLEILRYIWSNSSSLCSVASSHAGLQQTTKPIGPQIDCRDTGSMRWAQGHSRRLGRSIAMSGLPPTMDCFSISG